MSMPASNSAVMEETLSTDCEVSVFMSEILLSSSSSGRVISVSISSGATPEYTVFTATNGTVMSGDASFGTVRYE